MAFVTIDEVQQWLSEPKFTITEVDPQLEASAKEYVFSRLGVRYDTTSWTDAASTPPLVVKLLSMLVALYEYERAVSEDVSDGDTYTGRLYRRVEIMLEGIERGNISIGVDPADGVDMTTMAFYPTDEQDYFDPWSDEYDERRQIHIGMVF